MNCIECQESLVDHLEGLLNAATRAGLEAHLNQCQTCQAAQAAAARLHEQLLAHGRMAAGVSLANRVMNRIRRSQSTEPVAAAALARFWKWAVGLGAVTAMVVGGVLFFGSPRSQAMAAEVMAKGVQAARRLTTVHLVCRVRTAPADNFAQIDPQAGSVPVELWKSFGTSPKWRVEKPGRVAVMDGQSTLLFLRAANAALKVPQPSSAAFDTAWLHELADIENTLEAELRLARAKGWTMELTREMAPSGAMMAIVAIEAKSGLPESDYLRNKFFGTADTRRVYHFDDQTGRLKAVEVYLHTAAGDALILEVDRIDYNQPIEPAVFQLALPENVRWIQEPKVQAPDPRQAGWTAKQATEAFFEACAREDWAEAAPFLPLPLDDRLKALLGGLELVQLGEPFTSAVSRAKFVPYEIRLKRGEVRKHNLALKQRQNGAWIIDGGL